MKYYTKINFKYLFKTKVEEKLYIFEYESVIIYVKLTYKITPILYIKLYHVFQHLLL